MYCIYMHTICTPRGGKEVIKENVCESQLAGLSQVLRYVCVCDTQLVLCTRVCNTTYRHRSLPFLFSC